MATTIAPAQYWCAVDVWAKALASPFAGARFCSRLCPPYEGFISQYAIGLALRSEWPSQQRFDRLVHAGATGEDGDHGARDRQLDALGGGHLDQHRRGEHAFRELTG